ncbi:hypothetical protein C2845_PM02G06550 [Panicum miliaceum]|uniref:Uncharacterized protein n=1 Tax=Panicum miliaceum TaxID=4540 RepID=A0A3L6S7N4_PANMI|nr:hypothetical protein C2845_PM02G06550 [Panicum miliaceum]
MLHKAKIPGPGDGHLVANPGTHSLTSLLPVWFGQETIVALAQSEQGLGAAVGLNKAFLRFIRCTRLLSYWTAVSTAF